MYFYTCPRCGSNLDPGEKCDCITARESEGNRCRTTITTITDLRSRTGTTAQTTRKGIEWSLNATARKC